MAERPLLVGLTGSIGMGKSETAKMFARLGIPVYDADAEVHALYEAGGAAVTEIAKAFPGAVKDGRVDRAALAELLKGDEAKFKRLEAIVHPLVAERERSFIAAAAGADMVVLDIPLLFETGKAAHLDAVVVVSAPEKLQRTRVLERPGMSEERFEQILARQMPDAEKRAKADFVVETGNGLDEAFERVKAIVEELKHRNRHA